MRPLRLFVILVLLTACALTVVHYRVASVRRANRIQRLHARQAEARYEAFEAAAEAARLADPARIRKIVQTEQIPVYEPVLPGVATPGPAAPTEDEREEPPVPEMMPE